MVPLGSFLRWLSSTAGYVPGNEAQLSLSDIAHHKRVLSRGCYPFLSGRSENLSVFLASLSASTKGVNSNCKPLCLCSLPEPRDSVRRLFVGRNSRDRRDGVLYTENKFFDQLFVCFIFRIVIYFFDARGNPQCFCKIAPGNKNSKSEKNETGNKMNRISLGAYRSCFLSCKSCQSCQRLAISRDRKHFESWSFTIPTACIKE